MKLYWHEEIVVNFRVGAQFCYLFFLYVNRSLQKQVENSKCCYPRTQNLYNNHTVKSFKNCYLLKFHERMGNKNKCLFLLK